MTSLKIFQNLQRLFLATFALKGQIPTLFKCAGILARQVALIFLVTYSLSFHPGLLTAVLAACPFMVLAQKMSISITHVFWQISP